MKDLRRGYRAAARRTRTLPTRFARHAAHRRGWRARACPLPVPHRYFFNQVYYVLDTVVPRLFDDEKRSVQ